MQEFIFLDAASLFCLPLWNLEEEVRASHCVSVLTI